MMRLALLPVRLLVAMIGPLPLSVLHRAAVPLGWLMDRLPWSRHQVVDTNLRLCFPDLEPAARRRLRRRFLIELWRLALEAGALWHWSPDRLERHIRRDASWKAVEAAAADGRGVLIVSGHIGNWELLNLDLSRHLPMATLYRQPKSAALDAFITALRTRFGGRMIPGGSPALRDLLVQLKNGNAVGIAADIQPKQGGGVFADLFRTPALTMTLVNKLARKTGCAVFFAWAERLPGGRGWSFHFEPADEAVRSRDPVAALEPMNRWLEDAIRRAPPQYLWLYKRFSRRPPGEAPLYPKKRKRVR
ncbi:MAG: lipid A biosynthesis acyltransferase [Gammaproteobacteria bacterium]|jgi:KDO2-lipid IV(A) lauroyltransferase|nr:lipid A biosynthesis acyltransferase [Gammaproteobacteria bacterium]